MSMPFNPMDFCKYNRYGGDLHDFQSLKAWEGRYRDWRNPNDFRLVLSFARHMVAGAIAEMQVAEFGKCHIVKRTRDMWDGIKLEYLKSNAGSYKEYWHRVQLSITAYLLEEGVLERAYCDITDTLIVDALEMPDWNLDDAIFMIANEKHMTQTPFCYWLNALGLPIAIFLELKYKQMHVI